MNDPHDRILESFLEELVGGVHPPTRIDRRAVHAKSQRLGRPGATVSRWRAWAAVLVVGCGLGLAALAIEYAVRAPQVEANLAARGAAEATPPVAQPGAPRPTPRADSEIPALAHDPAAPADRHGASPADPLPTPAFEPAELAAQIDLRLRAAWRERGINPADPVADAAFVPTLLERLLGPTLSADERTRLAGLLQQRPRPDSINELFQSLTPAVASHLARSIADGLLAGRNAEPAVRAALEEYLASAIAERKTWQTIGFELLSAHGSLDRSASDYNPAGAYWLAIGSTYGGDLAGMTGHLAHSTLGQPLNCAACHEYAVAGQRSWTRRDFWQLASYLTQIDRQKGESGGLRLGARDFLPDNPPHDDDAPLFFEEADGRVVAVYPAFGGQAEDAVSGRVTAFDRRRVLAERISQSVEWQRRGFDYLAAALWGSDPANSGWLLEEAATSPLSSLRSEVGLRLADRSTPLLAVAQAMALSEVFAHAGEGAETGGDEPLSGTPALFSHRYRALPREGEVAASLEQLARDYLGGAAAGGVLARELERIQFAIPKEDAPAASPAAPEIERARIPAEGWGIQAPAADVLQRLMTAPIAEEQKVRHLFLAAIGRPPTQGEWKAVSTILAASNDRSAGLRDIWATLLFSREFDR